jgi:hypothetical protein
MDKKICFSENNNEDISLITLFNYYNYYNKSVFF